MNDSIKRSDPVGLAKLWNNIQRLTDIEMAYMNHELSKEKCEELKQKVEEEYDKEIKTIEKNIQKR